MPSGKSKAIIDAVSAKYPKFSKIQLSMIRNPQYGLQLAPGAVSLLRDAGIPPPGKTRSQKVKQGNKAKTRKAITIRFEINEYEELTRSKKPDQTMQDFIKEKLNQNGG